jgi:hypothetical protein
VQQKLDSDRDNPGYLSDLMRAKECMVRIMRHQVTAENHDAFVDLCNKMLDVKFGLNRRRPDRTEPTAYLFLVLGDVILEFREDKDSAKRLFREGIALARVHLSQKHSQPLEWNSGCQMAIRLGNLLRKDSPGANEAAAMYDQALLWAQGTTDWSRSREMRNLAAEAEFQLGVCRLEQNRSEEAIPLVQHAVTEIRRLSLDFPAEREYFESAQRAQDTLISQLQQSGRADEAKVATREMAEWLDTIQSRQKEAVEAVKNLEPSQTTTKTNN